MSARGDAARRRRWGEKDNNDAKQLEAMLESWLSVLPDDLCDQLEAGLHNIFGSRLGKQSLNSTPAERKQVLDLIEQINLSLATGHDQGVIQPGHEENSMSLEQALAANTAALEANTAALLKSGGAGTTSTKSTKTTTDKPKSTKTREELAAVMDKVKAAKGTPVAKGLIVEFGKPADGKLANVPEENIDALFAAAEAKLAEEEDM